MMILSTKTFHIFKHAKIINTPITVPGGGGGGGGGGSATARFYSSWIISKSFFEELSAAAPSVLPSTTSRHALVRPPCLMLPSRRDKSTGDRVFRFFNPIEKNIIKIKKKKTDSSPLPNSAHCLGSSHGWLAFTDTTDCSLYLWDPFPDDVVIQLPSIETLPHVVGTIRKSKDDVSIKKFILQHWSCERRYSQERYTPRRLSDFIIKKVAFSSPFDLLMAIEGYKKNLAFVKPGDTAWTLLPGPLNRYRQIIPSSIKDKVFYAMDIHGQVEAWDLRDLSCIKRTPIDYKRCLCTPKFHQLEADVRARCGLNQKRYLVESSGDLLLVYRHVADYGVAEDGTILSDNRVEANNKPHKTLRFDVYKMDFSLGKWTYVNSLGDRALFVGLSNSFCLRVCDYPGLRPNSIYFSDDSWRIGYKGYRYGGHDMGVYSIKDNSIEPFYPFGHLRKITPIPFWVAPNPHSGNVAESFA